MRQCFTTQPDSGYNTPPGEGAPSNRPITKTMLAVRLENYRYQGHRI